MHLRQIIGEPATQYTLTNVLQLNDQIKAYVDTHISRSWSAKTKLRMLRKMIFSDSMLDLHYDTTETRTAIGTFEARRGNCLSMTNLLIAMARYAELDAN
jgi:hypothetical protein